MMNVNHRGEELCSACGCATGHAGYGEGSIGYVDGTIGPLCNECNAQLCIEIEADSAEIKRLQKVIRLAGRKLAAYAECADAGRDGHCMTNILLREATEAEESADSP